MTLASIPHSDFESIFDIALTEYAKQTGIDLTKCPFANKLHNCGSPDAVIQLLEEHAQSFKIFRDRGSKLAKWFRPLVQVVYLVSGVFGHIADITTMNPARAIFVAIHVLLVAANGVSASYDALVDIFESVGNFLARIQIYAKIPLTPPMMDVIVKIMVELLSVLALSTKQIKQGRLKKFIKRLLGLGDRKIEAMLQRLDRLTQEEAQMATMETLELVHGLAKNIGVITDDAKISADCMRQTLEEMNKMKRGQLREKIRNWLSPPDPSKNHNTAWRNHHSGTSTWFTQGHTFRQWKETGSLLWIQGKPGSGKSTLCSAIIQEVKALPDAGSALMAYFYCDFRDSAKHDVHDVLTSLLAQLCAESDPFFQILFDIYSKHNAGSQQPDDHTLAQCLKLMLQLPGQPPVYLIIDAIDECPNITGIVSARDRVLELVEELVGLHLPNLRICLTSRPEADIRASLNSLAFHTVPLHEESGQKQDIVNYIRSVVQSDRIMRKWRTEDQQRIIDTLSERSGGMFRWVICQLEVLRRCIPAAIRPALDDLPRSLDETYERVLLEIAAEKRNYAHRLFQCLAVSYRPLRVQELAEILAIQFDGAFPTYNAYWRPEAPEDAVLSACSSLISVVEDDGSSVVQFSHFSVKEFLTSERLLNSGENLSCFHILPQSAHTTFTKACLSILLGDHTDKDGMDSSPLAPYAAQHWVYHGQFAKVSPSIMEDMKCLFDQTKPYFSRWVSMHDIDVPYNERMYATQFTTSPIRPVAAPLYYAIICGFRDLTEHLVVTFPQLVNARGGYFATPLHAAVTTRNVDITLLLLGHGAEVNTLDDEGWSPLHRASRNRDLDLLELLLKHQAYVNLPGKDGETPLFLASRDGDVEVARALIRYGAVVDAPEKNGWTPLMVAAGMGHLNVVQLLTLFGASVDARDNRSWTCSLHRDVVTSTLRRN